MAGAAAVGGSKSADEMSALFAEGQDGSCGEAFIKEIALDPYFLKRRLVEEIVDVPKSFLVFSEMALQPSIEMLFCPSHIEIFSGHEGHYSQFAYCDIQLFFYFNNKNVDAFIVMGHRRYPVKNNGGIGIVCDRMNIL